MRHEGTDRLFQYWTSRRDGRAAPLRADIAPAAIASVLSNTFILEETAAHMKYRLAGTRLCCVFGRELRGMPFADGFEASDRKLVRDALSAVHQDHAVMTAELHASDTRERMVGLELMLLPLADEQPRILGSLQFLDNPYWLGADPLGKMRLTSLSYLDSDKQFVVLQNRPPVMLPEYRPAGGRRLFHVLEGNGLTSIGTPRPDRTFSVIDGGRDS
ncbi:MAG: PAS domain-containing protein [Pseudomonadota bacterium]